MRLGARTPEELETLLEDAFVIRDRDELAGLFEHGAVLVAEDGAREARGQEAIAQLVSEMWERNRTYLADPPRVLQARDTGLVVTKLGVSVVRRASDGVWRYAIAHLAGDDRTTEEDR